MTRKDEIKTQGDDALERAKSMLRALSIDHETVEKIEVTVVRRDETEEEKEEEQNKSQTDKEDDNSEIIDEVKEIDKENISPEAPGHGVRYDGEFNPTHFDGLVVPDSKVGQTLGYLVNCEDEWITNRELAEKDDFPFEDPDRINKRLNNLLRKGVAVRREQVPQPDIPGRQSEYSLNENAEKLWRESVRAAEE